MPIKPEQIEMIKIFDWIRKNNLAEFAFHIANERKSSQQAGSLLKRMGVKSGVSDIFIAIPSNEFHGLWLELKAGKNRPTESQMKFLEDMRSKGYEALWCTGADKAKQIITDYLSE